MQQGKQAGGSAGNVFGTMRGLIALNAALLIVLAAVTFAGSAEAQQQRQRGEYTMVGGAVSGASAGAVYIVDVINQELIALVYDHNNQAMTGVGYRDLAQDAGEAARARGRN